MKLKELDINLPQSEMCLIAKKHGTDKSQYSRLYNELMKEKKENADIFEIGIFYGASLKMWADYFQSGRVCGIDNGRLLPNSGAILGESNQSPSSDDLKLLEGQIINCDFNWIENDRIKCAIADQRSINDINKALEYFGSKPFDFIVDDGHHFQEHQLKSLNILLKHVKPGGYYIIEDVVKYLDLLNGSFWGQTSDATDSTDFVFSRFLETNEFKSEYLTNEECENILKMIDDIFIYDSPKAIQSTSKVIVIKRK